jgi:UDP-N-acetylmuramoyl-tripeptide--D-alanyl-D-alanine ligase
MDAAILELVLRRCRGRRIAVLGQMLELGAGTERFHRSLGRKVANEDVDRLWAIGPDASRVAEEAVRMGMPAEHVRWHESLHEALEDPAFEPQPGDAWLFKGSRGMALERLAAHVRERARLLDPGAAADLSVSRLDQRRS